MMFSFVVPEIIIGIAMFMVFTYLLKFIQLGTLAQVLALVTYQASYPVIIVRARLLSIGRQYEEAAMDLGPRRRAPCGACCCRCSTRRSWRASCWCSPTRSTTSSPSGTCPEPSSTEPLSVKIYNFTRGTPTPAINAAATFMLISTTVIALIGFGLYKRHHEGPEGRGRERPARLRASRSAGAAAGSGSSSAAGTSASWRMRSASAGRCTVTGVPCCHWQVAALVLHPTPAASRRARGGPAPA